MADVAVRFVMEAGGLHTAPTLSIPAERDPQTASDLRAAHLETEGVGVVSWNVEHGCYFAAHIEADLGGGVMRARCLCHNGAFIAEASTLYLGEW